MELILQQDQAGQSQKSSKHFWGRVHHLYHDSVTDTLMTYTLGVFSILRERLILKKHF